MVVNLYPFEEATSKGNLSMDDAKEFIDIGGPSMLRSAAKNYQAVTVITDVADYDRVAKELEIEPTLIANRSQLSQIARQPRSVGDILLPWQAELLLRQPSLQTLE